MSDNNVPASTPPVATATAVLAPPEPLVAPAPVETVKTSQAADMVAVPAESISGLDKLVSDYAQQLLTADTKSPEFTAKADQIRTMGDDDIKSSSNISNRLLQKSVKDMKESVGENGKVPQTLLDLRRTIEDLDPKQATGVKKFLGMIPFGDKLNDYFRKYESSQKHLDAILQSLLDGQDELRRDNADLEQEKRNLWETMVRLKQYIYVADKLDKELATKISELKISDPQRAKTLEQDVLFYVRQKHQDLLTQLAVSIQGYLAIDLIKKNNTELIKGVDRATTTTISALRTAVIVAQALASQKLVLDQITALNTTTGNLIETTSEMLKEQSVGIQKQAASSTVDLDQLRKAFSNVYQAMDSIDTFKSEALTSMSTTINGLSVEVDKAQTYLARTNQTDSASVLPEVNALDITKLS